MALEHLTELYKFPQTLTDVIKGIVLDTDLLQIRLYDTTLNLFFLKLI